jgi:mono/diheme cytochrome c family protein
MRWAPTALLLLIGALWLLPSAPAAAQTDEATVDFYVASCGACHGAMGEGALGPSLEASTMSVDDIAAVIVNGASGMPGTDGLDDAALDALSAYVATFQTPLAAPTTTASGSSVYFANCAGCHGSRGEGGSGPSLQVSTMSLDGIVAVTAGGASGMPGYSGRLTADEIAAVAAFVLDVQSGTPPPSTTQPATTAPSPGSDIEATAGSELYRVTCAACHGADGSGGAASSILNTSLDEQGMIEIVTAGGGAMPGFGEALTAAQIGEIVTFVEGLGAGVDGPGAGSGTPTTQSSAAVTTAEVAAADTDDPTGPSFWGPLLATLGTLIGVTGGLTLNRRRLRNKVSREQQKEAVG